MRTRLLCALGLSLPVFLASPPRAEASGAPAVEASWVATLDAPVYVANAGDERLFVVERAGRIVIHDPLTGTLPTAFLDVSNSVDSTQGGGLYSVAFHPGYAENGRFFVVYTAPGQGEARFISTLARFEVSADNANEADPESGVILLEVAEPFPSHNMDQVGFGPDGYLYVSLGNGGDPDLVLCPSQQGDSLHGKILRLDVDVGGPPHYAIPPDNPFLVPDDGVRGEVWALGFRNPWRFSFDPDTGDLYIGDVGQALREEIDLQPAASPGGENYGWKVMEGTTCFEPDPVGANCPESTPPCGDAAYTPPIYEYDTTQEDCAVLGGYVYRGSGIPGLAGRYVFGDVCSATVWALEETEPGIWTRSELLVLEAEGRFPLTSFGVDAAGELYATVDDDVVRLVPEPGAGALWVAALAGLQFAQRVSRRASPSPPAPHSPR